jgi:uncharacterized protein (DUF1778 family)
MNNKREYAKQKNAIIKFRASVTEKELLNKLCESNNIDVSAFLLNYVRQAVAVDKLYR